jgi:hypothetical protein
MSEFESDGSWSNSNEPPNLPSVIVNGFKSFYLSSLTFASVLSFYDANSHATHIVDFSSLCQQLSTSLDATSNQFPPETSQTSREPSNFHLKSIPKPPSDDENVFAVSLYVITADVMPSTRLSSLSVARQSPQEQRQEVGECLCFGHVWNMMITFPPPRPENRYSHLKFVRHNQSVHATCFLPQIDC